MTDISIIVPIYNAENYIEETIKSIIGQTLKNIEIILVNDGSTDSSRKICEKYVDLDKRIILINKENGGLADARNSGLKKATGKYIMFIDADDLYEPDSCEHMYKVIEETKSDYVIGNYQMMDDDGRRWNNVAFDVNVYDEMELDLNDHKKSFFVMNSTAWNKIYRTEFLRKNGIIFKVPAPAEDSYFTLMCFIKAKKGFYTPKIIYLYRNSPNSLSKDCSLKYFNGINTSYRATYEAMKENKGLFFYRYVYAKINAYILCQIIDSEKITDEEKIGCLSDFSWYFNLGEELKVDITHESLQKVMLFIKDRNYYNALKEMNELKEYRKIINLDKRKRMSYPTEKDYQSLKKFDKEFIGK